MPEIELDILIEDERWHDTLPNHEKLLNFAIEKTISTCSDASHYEISCVLTNDAAIQILNKDYRYKDAPTNVLSFPLHDWNNDADLPVIALGDVVIALDTIQSEAIEQNKRLEDHFTHMVVHSVLHLFGYDHEEESDAQRMENLEIEILKQMDIKNPYEIYKNMR